MTRPMWVRHSSTAIAALAIVSLVPLRSAQQPAAVAGASALLGRQYVAFCASHYANLEPGTISTFQGKAENQGYYVFALPR